MIRQANLQDGNALGKVYCNSWKTAYKDIIPNEYLDTLTIENCTPKKINANTNLVIEDNGVVVGVVNFGVSRDKGMLNCGELRSIYLLPDFWGKGFGKALFTDAVKEMLNLGYEKFFLWVLKDNIRARKFYEKMGMHNANEERKIEIGGKEISEIKYEFANKQNAMLMF